MGEGKGGADERLVLGAGKLKNQSPDQQQAIIFQFLSSLESTLGTLTTPELKPNQPAIEKQLFEFVAQKSSGPVRQLIARCFVILYLKGDSRPLVDTITSCQSMTKGSAKSAEISVRVTAIHIIGELSKAFPKQLFTLQTETSTLLLKLIKSNEPTIRLEATYALKNVVQGSGKSGNEGLFKDILKAARSGMNDKNISIRIASTECATTIIENLNQISEGDVENTISSSIKALDGSNYSLRYSVALLLGKLLSKSQKSSSDNEIPTQGKPSKKKNGDFESMFSVLATGFLKAGSSKDVRVGIAEAYGTLFQNLGAAWVESNATSIIEHIMNLGSHSKINSNSNDEAFTRECLGYILRSCFGKLLNENAQLKIVKELTTILNTYPTPFSDSSKATTPDPSSMRYSLVIVLNELSSLFQDLGSSVIPVCDTLLEPLVTVAGHPSFAVRQAVAWTFRSLALASKSNITKYIYQVVGVLKASHIKISSDKTENLSKLRGQASCLSALIACIPHCLIHVSFEIPEDILSFAVKIGTETYPDPQLTLTCQEVSWSLLAALTSLGSSFIKPHLSKYVSLWQTIFSKPSRDSHVSDEEWKNTIRARESALACLDYFLQSCSSLLTTDLSKKITNYLNTSLVFLAIVPSNKFQFHILKMRLFRCFLSLPPSTYELSHVPLLRAIVEVFTVTNTTNDTPTSLFHSQSNPQDAALFGWNFESDEKQIEQLLLFPLAGATEFDPHIICQAHSPNTTRPTPVPPEIGAVDSAIELFEKIFPIQQHQTQEQILEQFVKVFKSGKPSSKKYCQQINTFTALMSALKNLMNRKSSLSRGKVSALLQELIQVCLVQSDNLLRYAAAETLGRLTGVVGGHFISSLVKSLLDSLISAPEPTAKAGYILALGCVMRYVGGMSASSHLQAAVGIIHSLCNDTNPIVHTWAIHSLWIAIDSAGLMFQPFVNSSLNLLLKLYLSDAHENSLEKDFYPDLYQSIGRLLNSLMGTLGPELQTSKVSRDLCLCIYRELINDHDQKVVAQAIHCISHLIIFAPSLANVTEIVPVLQTKLINAQLPLRKACYQSLRELIQRQPQKATEIGNSLEEQLYSGLDTESNPKIRDGICEMITELLSATATTSPSRWIELCRQILSNSGGQEKNQNEGANEGDNEGSEGEEEEEEEENKPKQKTKGQQKPRFVIGASPRWQTKVFAVNNIKRLMTIIGASQPQIVKAHFDLGVARNLRSQRNKGDFIIFKLNELIKIAFNASTSSIDDLRLAGLGCLQEVIERFAPSEDPDYEEHSILEQYQAQISAALRPSFGDENSCFVLCSACSVCSIYISNHVISEVADFKRVISLLTTFLEKFKEEESTNFPSESLSTLSPHAYSIVKLSVLTAWADLFVASIPSNNTPNFDIPEDTHPKLSTTHHFTDLIEEYLPLLSRLWSTTLYDYAQLQVGKTLPALREVLLPYYQNSWIIILEAISKLDDKKLTLALKSASQGEAEEMDGSKLFFVIFSLCVEALFDGKSNDCIICLQALEKLLKPWIAGDGFFEKEYFTELLCVLNRIVQIDDTSLYFPVIKLMKEIVNCHSNLLFTEQVQTGGRNDAKIQYFVRIIFNLFLRHIPHISQFLGTPIASSRCDEGQTIGVINATLDLLSLLVSLAPEKEQTELSPFFLFIVTSLFTCDNLGIRNGTTSATLQSLRVFATKTQIPQNEESKKLFASCIQQTLKTMFTNIENEFSKMKQESIGLINNLILASVLITSSLANICLNEEILNTQAKVIIQGMNSNNSEISIVCLQCMRSLIGLAQKPGLSYYGINFIKVFVPEIVIWISKKTKASSSDKNEISSLMFNEISKIFNIMVAINELQKQTILSIVIPTSIVTLELPHIKKDVIQYLTSLAQESPLQFKSVVASLPQSLKSSLENALTQATQANTPKNNQNTTTNSMKTHQPTIQLKMNFGSFT